MNLGEIVGTVLILLGAATAISMKLYCAYVQREINELIVRTEKIAGPDPEPGYMYFT